MSTSREEDDEQRTWEGMKAGVGLSLSRLRLASVV